MNPISDLNSKVLNARWLLILGLQAGVIIFATWFALLLRFDFSIPRLWSLRLHTASLVHAATYLVALWLTGSLTGLWRYVTLRDAIGIAKGCILGAALAFGGNQLLSPDLMVPRGVSILTMLLAFLGLTGLRTTVRLLREAHSRGPEQTSKRRLVIVGAGDAGFQIGREILDKHGHRYLLAGYLDDDPTKAGQRILGVAVLGPTSALEGLHLAQGLDEVVIAMPSAGGEVIRRLQNECARLGVAAKSLPGMSSLIDGRVAVSQIRPVSLEDLLRRPQAELDSEAISGFLFGKTVMVTGAGGSIGSELCRQAARFAPKVLILVDQAETALYEIELWLRERFPNIEVIPVLLSLTDPAELVPRFQAGVDVVLHAAAYKHVPLLEGNPGQALHNNVRSTREVARLAIDHGTPTFVMVSTDKAVRPTSVMGASKRVCELMLQGMSRLEESQTRFITVRFGNVLGSNGSVIPRFRKQIKAGGPVTVTHPEITRYFMTIPEASQLVLQAATMGEGGEIFILEMGDPIKIVDLAKDLIRLSGLEPDRDIELVYTGLRPGEKLYEELLLDEETTTQTTHPSIQVGRTSLRDPLAYLGKVDRLLLAERPTGAEVRAGFRDLIEHHDLASTSAAPLQGNSTPLTKEADEAALGAQE